MRVKIKELCDIYPGKEYKHLPVGPVPVYNISGPADRGVDRSISGVPVIAVGQTGTVGKPRLFEPPVWISSTQIYVVPKQGVPMRYLFALFDGKIDWKRMTDSLASRDALNRTALENFEVKRLTPEQQKEAGDKYFWYLSKRAVEERGIEELERLKKALYCLFFPRAPDPLKGVHFDKLGWQQPVGNADK